MVKRDRYGRAGVREYWVVDPSRKTVLLFRRGPAGFLPAVELAAEAGDRLSSPLLPGLALRLDAVFG